MQKNVFYCPDTKAEWPSCYCLCDMMAFFPSCEQLDYPHLRGFPVAVTNGEAGSTIISSSYECRVHGIKTGMKVKEARRLCPDLIIRPTRPGRYTELSTKIMNGLTDAFPDIEVYSIDECFINLKPVLSYYKSVTKIAELIRQIVFDASGGIRCSIGISEGMLTAKFCAKAEKGGTTIVPPNEIKSYIGSAPVKDICGIGKNIERYLKDHGIHYCRDMEKYPMSILASRFGDLGRRLYSVCLGHDPFTIKTEIADPKSMSHGKVLPPATIDKAFVFGVLRRLTERLSARLRKNEMCSDLFSISYKQDLGWVSHKYRCKLTNQSRDIWKLIEEHFAQWQDEPLYQVQITAVRLESIHIKQLDLFEDNQQTMIKSSKTDTIKDLINQKFGKHVAKSGTELHITEEQVKPVISFNWGSNKKKDTL